MRSSRLEGCFVYSHLGLVGCNIVLMKRFLTLLLILPLLFSWSCEEDTAGPEAVITFEKDIGHGKLAVKQTKDGGYIVAGGNSDAWLLKTDKYGKKEWENTYSLGAFGNSRAVIQTSDGGYLYAGWEGIVKADSNGVEEWKNVSHENGAYPYYEDVIQHSNGNYYAVGGPGAGQAQLVKFSQTGSVLTRKWYGGQCEDDIFRSIIETPDEMLIIVGEKSHGNQSFPCAFNFMYYKDIWIIKTRKNGGVEWEKTHGGPYMEMADDIARIESGGYMLIGNKCDHLYDISSCGQRAKVLVMQIDEEGNNLNQELFSGLNWMERIPYYSITTTDGGFAWVAEHKNNGTWIYKSIPNEDTTYLFSNGFGGFEINQTTDGGFIIGTLGGILIKTDSELFYE